MVALSFSDSDLGGAGRGLAAGRRCPSCGSPALRDLRHPMSVDLWIDAVAAQARVILVRSSAATTGGATAATGWRRWRASAGIALALLPGECRDEDARLAALLDAAARGARRRCSPISARAGRTTCARCCGGWRGLRGAMTRRRGRRSALPRAGLLPARRRASSPLDGGERHAARPVVPILFYRSMLLADDDAPIDALAAALEAEGHRGRADLRRRA